MDFGGDSLTITPIWGYQPAVWSLWFAHLEPETTKFLVVVSVGWFQIFTWKNGCFTKHPLKKWLFGVPHTYIYIYTYSHTHIFMYNLCFEVTFIIFILTWPICQTEEPKLQQLLRPREPGTGGMGKTWIQTAEDPGLPQLMVNWCLETLKPTIS